jgi:protocatechuate 3,4-dioxygenase alpha subunit
VRTPSQTVGPFFEFGLCDRPANELPGGDLRLRGRVLDGAGEPVSDAMLEIWSPDAGFGRCGTDAGGTFEFVLPRTPHYEVMVFARGLLKPVVTRLYFDASDVPASVPEERRGTLVAMPVPGPVPGPGGGALRFDVHLQGELETVFFEL